MRGCVEAATDSEFHFYIITTYIHLIFEQVHHNADEQLCTAQLN